MSTENPFLRGYQRGQTLLRQQQKDANDAEDRKFEIEKRSIELKAFKLLHDRQEKEAARNEAMQMAQLVQGQPAPTSLNRGTGVPTAPLQTQGAPVPSDFSGGMGETPAPQQTTPLQHPKVTIPGVAGPDVQVQPQSMEQLLMQKRQAAIEAAQNESFTLNPGDKRFRGATMTAENPKDATNTAPKNPGFRDVEDPKTGITREYFDQSDPGTVIYRQKVGPAPDRNKADNPITVYQTTQLLDKIVKEYGADPVVNVAVKGQTAKRVAKQVIADPAKATNQLAALYLYVKQLDPDSAVREGETALAQLTQSYFQRFGAAFTRVAAGQVIAPDAAKQLAQATIDLVGAWEETSVERGKQFQSRADLAGVGPQFSQHLGRVQITPNKAAGPASSGPPAPKGIDPEDWKYMTPEEKAKWKN